MQENQNVNQLFLSKLCVFLLSKFKLTDYILNFLLVYNH